jgi:hypothetical protein
MIVTPVFVNHQEQLGVPRTHVVAHTWVESCSLVKFSIRIVIHVHVKKQGRLIVQLIPVDAQLLEELIILGNNGTQMNVIHALANKVDSLRARKMQSLVFATTKAEDIIFANSSHWRTDAQDAVANQMEK